jgi:hypothetical protein
VLNASVRFFFPYDCCGTRQISSSSPLDFRQHSYHWPCSRGLRICPGRGLRAEPHRGEALRSVVIDEPSFQLYSPPCLTSVGPCDNLHLSQETGATSAHSTTASCMTTLPSVPLLAGLRLHPSTTLSKLPRLRLPPAWGRLLPQHKTFTREFSPESSAHTPLTR